MVLAAIRSSIPVLVTGASSGIGAEFARQFAERGHDVTIVARRNDRLEGLAIELRAQYGVAVTTIGADLASERGRAKVAKALRAGSPWILVNNAGFGSRGLFHELNATREAAEVLLNVVAVEELSAAVLPGNVAARAGGLINVASTAAFQPLAYMATYGATKAFVLHFTEGISVELRDSGVRVMALCPGATRTEFGGVAGNARELEMVRPMSAEQCVYTALQSFDRNRPVCIPGAVNAAMAQLARIAPRPLTRRLAGMIFAPR